MMRDASNPSACCRGAISNPRDCHRSRGASGQTSTLTPPSSYVRAGLTIKGSHKYTQQQLTSARTLKNANWRYESETLSLSLPLFLSDSRLAVQRCPYICCPSPRTVHDAPPPLSYSDSSIPFPLLAMKSRRNGDDRRGISIPGS